MQHLRRLHSHGFAEVNLICNARVTAPLPTVCGGPLIIIQPAAASDPVGPILSGVRAGGQGQRGQEDHGRLGGGHDEGPHWSQAPGRWRRGGAPGRSAHQYLHTCYANQSYNLGLCKRSHTQPTPKPAAPTASPSFVGVSVEASRERGQRHRGRAGERRDPESWLPRTSTGLLQKLAPAWNRHHCPRRHPPNYRISPNFGNRIARCNRQAGIACTL